MKSKYDLIIQAVMIGITICAVACVIWAVLQIDFQALFNRLDSGDVFCNGVCIIALVAIVAITLNALKHDE